MISSRYSFQVFPFTPLRPGGHYGPNVIIAALAVASVLFAYRDHQASRAAEQQSQLLIETRERPKKSCNPCATGSGGEARGRWRRRMRKLSPRSWLRSKRLGMQPSKPPRQRASVCRRFRTRWQIPSKPCGMLAMPWTRRRRTEMKPWSPWRGTRPRRGAGKACRLGHGSNDRRDRRHFRGQLIRSCITAKPDSEVSENLSPSSLRNSYDRA